MTRTGVSAHFSATHRQSGGAYHGHTWEVTAWFPNSTADALSLQSRLRSVLRRFDHKTLPDELSRGEMIAQEIGEELDGCAEVLVARQIEGIFAQWTREDQA
jgi:6-pyruvoyl-tetrahydropterin synthase